MHLPPATLRMPCQRYAKRCPSPAALRTSAAPASAPPPPPAPAPHRYKLRLEERPLYLSRLLVRRDGAFHRTLLGAPEGLLSREFKRGLGSEAGVDAAYGDDEAAAEEAGRFYHSAAATTAEIGNGGGGAAVPATEAGSGVEPALPPPRPPGSFVPQNLDLLLERQGLVLTSAAARRLVEMGYAEERGAGAGAAGAGEVPTAGDPLKQQQLQQQQRQGGRRGRAKGQASAAPEVWARRQQQHGQPSSDDDDSSSALSSGESDGSEDVTAANSAAEPWRGGGLDSIVEGAQVQAVAAGPSVLGAGSSTRSSQANLPPPPTASSLANGASISAATVAAATPGGVVGSAGAGGDPGQLVPLPSPQLPLQVDRDDRSNRFRPRYTGAHCAALRHVCVIFSPCSAVLR